MCDFLTLPFAEAMTQHQEQSSTEPEEFLQWKEKVKQAVTATQVGRFRTELNAQEISTFEAVAGPLLQSFDYKLHQ